MGATTIRQMTKTGDHYYQTADGKYVVQREYGQTPNGNPLVGRWVLRGESAEFIDFDRYLNDLAERHHFRTF